MNEINDYPVNMFTFNLSLGDWMEIFYYKKICMKF